MQLRYVLAASAALVGALGAGVASAQTVHLTGAYYGSYEQTYITTPGGALPSGAYIANPLQLSVQPVDASGNPDGLAQTLYAFCVDVYHKMESPIATKYNPPGYLTYNIEPLTNDSSGTTAGSGAALSSSQIAQIGALAQLGNSLATEPTPPTNLNDQLAALQDAIWQIEYIGDTTSAGGGYTFTPITDKTAVSSLESADITYAEANAYYGPVDALVSANGNTQTLTGGGGGGTLGGGSGAVPEPAAWALMLIGLGAMGSALRAQRRVATA